ncbi:hypothetical protein BJ165DRAFT_1112785 [Panaeolus papilionaceus]|nr:hypothetical protein BJ165DRAFT_1112785 [Panaeolus papilionaceus]
MSATTPRHKSFRVGITIIGLLVLSFAFSISSAVVAGIAAENRPLTWVVVPFAIFTVIHHSYAIFRSWTRTSLLEDTTSQKLPLSGSGFEASCGVLAVLWAVYAAIYSYMLWWSVRSNSIKFAGLEKEDIPIAIGLAAIAAEATTLIVITTLSVYERKKIQRNSVATQSAT